MKKEEKEEDEKKKKEKEKKVGQDLDLYTVKEEEEEEEAVKGKEEKEKNNKIRKEKKKKIRNKDAIGDEGKQTRAKAEIDVDDAQIQAEVDADVEDDALISSVGPDVQADNAETDNSNVKPSEDEDYDPVQEIDDDTVSTEFESHSDDEYLISRSIKKGKREAALIPVTVECRSDDISFSEEVPITVHATTTLNENIDEDENIADTIEDNEPITEYENSYDETITPVTTDDEAALDTEFVYVRKKLMQARWAQQKKLSTKGTSISNWYRVSGADMISVSGADMISISEIDIYIYDISLRTDI
ncbi:hypothetical protein Cni_G19571 [Canna indica]|uniref:Uncharacterized protein n=1 Tax=Canna indica TaxID=4628 RepID=A0AAQ3KKU2_9LILI|nr:hypothetical protein Cni_G19571 [Canna indica]